MAGRYRLEEPVGRGGFAVVHRAYDRTLHRHVAVKLLNSTRSGDTLGEARAAAKLNHPNVARVYDYGVATTPFLVMEFVDGDTLADRLDRGGPLPLPDAAAVCAQVADALAAAHAQQLVHRDIKPRNIMLAPTGVKVVDFGVAAMAGQRSADDEGLVWGTPLYLAPEQLRGERCFPAADVFALGLLLHSCLTGTPPWSGAGADEVFAARRLRPVPALPCPQDFPPDLVALHDRCVHPVPGRRPDSAEVAAVLRRYATGTRAPRPATTVTLRAAPARRPRAVLVGTATAGALLAGALALTWSPGSTTEAAAQGAVAPGSPARPATGVSSTPAETVGTTRATTSTAPVRKHPHTTRPGPAKPAVAEPGTPATPTRTPRPSASPSAAPASTLPASSRPSAAPSAPSPPPSPSTTGPRASASPSASPSPAATPGTPSVPPGSASARPARSASALPSPAAPSPS
ncbi:serine/threonine-protein kinase [Actinoplanes sp. N902-109]|uniref:serine/threonine-protein kinase n=1 Tax=Actinoplanes sp. (strain N902-109) TaxID=649831 RepID=UPI001E2DB0BE|nr:serine/threonine-protein kinase [Actinoplanes sp. N902-109]